MGTGRELRSRSASLCIYYSLNLYQWTSVSWIHGLLFIKKNLLEKCKLMDGSLMEHYVMFSLESLLDRVVVLFLSCNGISLLLRKCSLLPVQPWASGGSYQSEHFPSPPLLPSCPPVAWVRLKLIHP